jgi:hypothetical protein
MRRILLVLIVLMMMPQMPVRASEVPFNFYIDEEVVIHPGETVPFRIAWHNLVGFERHFEISINQSHSNLTISDIPEDWTRVASGRLGELNINISNVKKFLNGKKLLKLTCLSLDGRILILVLIMAHHSMSNKM